MHTTLLLFSIVYFESLITYSLYKLHYLCTHYIMSKYLITIIGPTASGKSSLAIQLAKYFQTEIISADSRQFYQELTIGTAKPSEEELKEVKHHFINSFSIKEFYTAGNFENDALEKIKDIHQKNDIAIMVGGSGLYINAVLFGIDPFPDIPIEIRKKAIILYKEKGLQALRDELREKDPVYFLEVDLDNPRRLMRALEVCYATQQPYSSLRRQKPKKRNFKPIKIALDWKREDLYKRIDERVDKMVENGLIQECQELLSYKSLPALDTIGYKEIFDFLEGKTSKDEAIELIKRNSRRYAKRQMTWFKKDDDIKWFKPETSIDIIIQHIREKQFS